MLTISKPLSAGQASRYHQEEFGNARENYYTHSDQIRGAWHGQLARRWGLTGEVSAEHFQRLAEGQHPFTGESLVRHRAACTYTNDRGQTATTMAHRAGWDATFSAPKSVSLTALVGGDARVREAHRESVSVALEALEHYTQARRGDQPAETTGQWVAARFEHDSARPVDGYAAPQLHTHVVVFNVTHTAEGKTRPLQPRELYRSQQYATAVYRSALATRLTQLGYAIERGASDQPEIRGYTPEYLEASSPRRQQIEAHLEAHQRRGAGAAQIAAHHTREAKLVQSHDPMQARHRTLAEAFGHQPARVVDEAMARGPRHAPHPPGITAHAAVTFATDRNLEREAVVDERALLRDALRRSMGKVPADGIRAEFERRVASGALMAVEQRPDAPSRVFTTREMIDLEQATIHWMREGQQRHAAVREVTPRALAHAHPHLNEGQRDAVAHVLGSRDQISALEGVAGAGKTTALATLRAEAERAGYRVEGFAPTSRAAQQLNDAGIPAGTVQRYLAAPAASKTAEPRLYVLDESSLASTRQMHAFLQRLGPHDRVWLVGDVRQHQAVEAGRPYQQLQEAGMATARLDQIVRQQDPGLKAVVEQLARGETAPALRQLESQGRLHEIPDREARLDAIARDYVRQPVGTLVVSPDNASRMALNETIHQRRQAVGQVAKREHQARVLVPRQEITGADRQWAAQYQPGDVVRYTTGSQARGLHAGAYARVVDVRADDNQITVRREHGGRVTYDPRRLHGVTLYREQDRAFAVGDRVQFTVPDRERHVANRELGTIEALARGGQVHLRLDTGRTLQFALRDQPHLDYGYAVTSHSSQGQTADRVLVQIDTERAGAQLVNQRLAYVAVSRGRYDAQIYTNDTRQLGEALSRDVTHRSAIEPGVRSPARGIDPPSTPRHEPDQSLSQGLSR